MIITDAGFVISGLGAGVEHMFFHCRAAMHTDRGYDRERRQDRRGFVNFPAALVQATDYNTCRF